MKVIVKIHNDSEGFPFNNIESLKND